MILEFSKALILTSPPEKSDRVGDVQYLLSGNNIFKQNFHPGPLDKQMGKQVDGSIRRCKYFLGYPNSKVNGAFGQTLYLYLLGKQKLPLANRLRRKQRLSQAAKVVSGKKQALQAALNDATKAIHEYPVGSNLNQYGAWYGFNGVAWCCEAITYWLVTNGNKWWTKGSFASYVGSVVDAARAGQRHLALTSDPEPGDAVIYENDRHIEFFVQWIDRPAGSFVAVGGNTSGQDGSYNNGGEVAKNTRYTKGNFPVTQFVRIGF